MSSAKAPHLAQRFEPAVSICQEIRAYLENRRDQVCQEITRHPTPIPACDVHFNRLLEERTKIFQTMDRLDELCRDDRIRGNNIAAWIDDFICSSETIDDEDRRMLRAAAKKAFSERDG